MTKAMKKKSEAKPFATKAKSPKQIQSNSIAKGKGFKNKKNLANNGKSRDNASEKPKKLTPKKKQNRESEDRNSELDSSELMEVEYGSDVQLEESMDEKVPQLKDNSKNKKVTQKAVKGNSAEGKKKPNKVQFSKTRKGKSADESSSNSDKSSMKRKRTDDGEESVKPKKAKLSTKESKKAQLDAATFKERKKVRKMQNKNYELSIKAKLLWEQLRRADLTDEKRQEVCEELYNLAKGHMQILIFAHDTSRVIQSLVKHGTKEHRDAVFEELKGNLLDILMSKYAKFFVRRMMKYGKKSQREYIFEALKGHFKKLLRHKEAGEIVEVIYNNYANATQRNSIVEEFYGKAFQLLKTGEAKTFQEVLKADPSKRELLMGSLKKSLTVLVDKSMLEYSLVHHLFIEYFTNADEAMRTDMIEIVREGLAHMIHTRDGSRVAMTCLWHGTAKDRKVIVKSFKSYIAKICKEEYGHLVMLALFDVVDDTKLVQKAILDELIKSADELANDAYGRKVLLYLLASRDPLHFHPDIVSVLQKGDGNVHSKKQPDQRRQELCQYVSKPLLQWIVDNSKSIVKDNSLLLLLSAIIKHALTDPTAAMKAIAEIAAEPMTLSQNEWHLVSNTAGHLTLKHLIADDKERSASPETVLFSNILLETVPEEHLLSWLACNRGCFVLVSMFETKVPGVVTRLANLLSNKKSLLKKQTFVGAQVLLKKMLE